MKKNIFLFFTVGLGACAHSISYETKSVSAPSKAAISISTDWVKFKGTKVEMMTSITNNTTKNIEIDEADFSCERAGNIGEASHDFESFGRPEAITLLGEQTRTALVSCATEVMGKGNITLKVAQVFEQKDAEGERRTMGKNLSWEFAPAGEQK
jgi:hypothetical protein